MESSSGSVLTAATFDRFVRESAGPTRAVIGRLLRHDADADDALQETYLAAWKARDSFDGRSAVGTWIHRIAVNTSLNKLRQKKSLRQLLETDRVASAGEGARPLEPASGEAEVSGSMALKEVVWRAVDELPEDARLVLVLRDVEGFSSEEVSAKLGISDASVRQRLHRARRTVAERLRPELCGAGDLTCGGELGLLLDYLDGALTAEWEEPVTAHVAGCPTCVRYAAAYGRMIALPREALAGMAVAAVPAEVVDRILDRVRAG